VHVRRYNFFVVNRARTIRILIFVVLLCLAAILRLYQLDLLDVRYDEAIAPVFAYAVAHGQHFATVPFSGSVANHPPVWLYVLALPYLFTNNFYFVVGYRIMLDVLAVALSGWLGARFFNRRVGWLTMLFFATVPWAVYFSRKLWTAPLALFSTLALLGLLVAAQQRTWRAWLLAGCGMALAVGTHLAAVFWLPVFAFVFLLNVRSHRWTTCLAAWLPLIAVAAIYLGADAQRDFVNLRALFATNAQPAKWTTDAFSYASWISGGLHLRDLTGAAYAQWLQQPIQMFAWLDMLPIIILFCAVLVALANGIHRAPTAQQKTLLVCLAWLLIPLILQIRQSRDIQIQYVSNIYPAPFVLMAYGVDWLIARFPKMRAAVIALVTVMVAWQSATTLRFADFVATHETGGYRPIRPALAAVADARRLCSNCELIGVTIGGDANTDEDATILKFLMLGDAHRIINGNDAMLYPQSSAVYIFAGQTRARQMQSLAVEPRYLVARFDAPKSTTNLGQWENGVMLNSYTTTMSNGELFVRAQLTITQPPDATQDVHWFVHVQQSGKRIAQADIGGVLPRDWKVGDVIQLIFVVKNVEQFDTLRLGGYTFPQLKPITIRAADGTFSDAITLAAK
jgi:4-amino-4-deoxy-L-arabinose transferase-like glycosyltransferase